MSNAYCLAIAFTCCIFDYAAAHTETSESAPAKPNIVYIMSDELAYFEVGYNGQKLIRTPRIDQMAKEGLVFTNAYAAAPVCGPLRACLMTGKHMGHVSVRLNDGGTPLRVGEPTIASMLKGQGYATGGFGKWGAGGRGSTGVPEEHGFDTFFGYYDQVHAHSFFPPYLILNSQEVPLKGNRGGRSGETYSHYEIMKEGLNFIREKKDVPFFCYLPITPPHGMYDIPDSDPAWELYKDKKGWSEDAKRYAAMVTMVDRNVGQVLDLLKELKLDENTIVFVAGDNGGEDRFRTPDHPRGFFGPNLNPKTGVGFRGGKRLLYEGGLKIPSLVRWPNKIKPERTSDLIWSQIDLFPTLAELVGGQTPNDLDGISILPTILDSESEGVKQEQHKFLYWEYGKQIAVRKGKWKAVYSGKPNTNWELYDLSTDVSESKNLATQHPKALAELIGLAKASHVPADPGTFATRKEHERDRWAKWGDTQPEKMPKKKITAWNKSGLLDSSKIKVLSFSSENRNNNRLAKMAFDANPATWWHTGLGVDPQMNPHEMVVDLGQVVEIKAIRYMARQDDSFNGTFKTCEITFSETLKETTASPVKIEFKKTRNVQNVKIPVQRGRYVRIRPLKEIDGNPWASAAEIGFVLRKN